MRRIALAISPLLLCPAACSQQVKPIFERQFTAIEWPKRPDQPRIRYIGQLTGEQSLNARTKGLEALGELITGPRPKWGFSTPTAVIARGSRVYVADGQNQAVFILDLDTRSFKAIREASGQNFDWPADVCFAGNELIVADSKKPGVYYFDLDGNYRRSLDSASFKRPCALAYSSTTQSLYVVDAAEHACLIFDASGQPAGRFGQRGPEPASFNFPAGLAATRDGDVIIADAMNFRVQVLSAQGSPQKAFGKKGDAAGDFALPRDIALDSENHIYVLDNQFENIQIFDRGGQLLMAWGVEGRGPGEFYLPSGISIDEQDRIWVADTYNRRVQVFQYLRGEAP